MQKVCDLLGPAGICFDAANTGSWRIERPRVKEDDCIKCGICAKFCPVEAITVIKEEPISFLWDYCKGCGICANECPRKCIEMIPECGGEV